MNTLTRSWGVWVIRGIASILFGVLTVLMPGASVAALIVLYGAYALADGALLLGYMFRTEGPKGPYFWRGLVSVAAGLVAFAYPGLTAVSLYVLIGAWAIAGGVTDLVLAATLRKDGFQVGGVVAAGILSITCGIGLFTLPAVGVAALVAVVAAYAIANGALLVAAGVRAHHITESLVVG